MIIQKKKKKKGEVCGGGPRIFFAGFKKGVGPGEGCVHGLHDGTDLETGFHYEFQLASSFLERLFCVAVCCVCATLRVQMGQ